MIGKPAGGAFSVHERPLPSYGPSLAADGTVTLVSQVNGKVRDRVTAPAGISDEQVHDQVQQSHRVRRYLNGRVPDTIIVVPRRLVNVVV